MNIKEMVQQVLDGSEPGEVVEGWYKNLVTPIKDRIRFQDYEVIGRENAPRRSPFTTKNTTNMYLRKWSDYDTSRQVDDSGYKYSYMDQRAVDPVTGAPYGRGLRVLSKGMKARRDAVKRDISWRNSIRK